MQTPSRESNLIEFARKLQEELDLTVAKNQSLRDQIQEATEQAHDADVRAKAAEQRSTEVEDKLAILHDLKTKEYQTVITELFETPSKKAATLTLLVAVVSIVVSITVGIVQTILSRRATAEDNRVAIHQIQEASRAAVQETATSLNKLNEQVLEEIRKSEARTNDRLTTLNVANPRVQQIVTLLTRNAADFHNYPSEKYLRLAYKLRLVPEVTPTAYLLYMTAFREAGISRSVVPRDEDTLARWDSEMVAMYKKVRSSLIV
jgi:hypothetical protein